MMLKVFISYSSSERLQAVALQTRLEAAGIQVWRDETRLETDWSREIAHGLIESDALCLLWSEAASQSTWVRNEWLTARALNKLIVPCLLEGAPALPRPLLSLQRVSLQNFDSDLDSVSRRLKSAGLSPISYDYSIIPPAVYVPFNPNLNFVGRVAQIVDLYRQLIGNLDKVGVGHVGLVGLGGVGKTQLAVEFAYRFAFAFTAVYWIEAADPERWSDLLIGIARDRLNLQVEDPHGPEAGRRYLFALQKYYRENPGQLLVMDNVVEPLHLNDDRFLFGWSPLSLGCSVLYTTRRYADLPGVINQPLEPVSTEDAFRLLTIGREPASPAESAGVTSIAEALGNLPLALVLAGSYLQKFKDVSFQAYRDVLLAARLDTIETDRSSPQGLATRHREALRTTLKGQWTALTDENARALLLIASAFPEASVIPKARLRLLFGDPRPATGLDRPFDRAFNNLRELVLVEELGTGIPAVRLHPLVREFVKGTLSSEERSASSAAAAERLRIAYEVPARLQMEYAERGVDSVLEDLAWAALWNQSPELEGLRQAIERDMHVLRKEGGGDALSDFLLQLHFRTHMMGQAARSAALAEECARSGPFLHFTATSRPDDPAWIRSLPGAIPFSCSRDGLRVLATSGETRLVLLDTANGKTLRILDGHEDPIRAVSLSGDGSRAVSGSVSGEVILWDLGNGQALRRMRCSHAPVCCVGIDHTGRLGVSGSDDGALVAWELERGVEARRIHLEGYPTCLSLSESGRALIGTLDDMVLLWDLAQPGAPHLLGRHEDFIYSVEITPDGRFGVSCTKHEPAIRVWDIGRRELIHTCNETQELKGEVWLQSAASVSLSESGGLVAGGMGDGTLRLWELPDAKLRLVLRGHTEEVKQVSLNRQGTRVVGGHFGGENLILWDTTGSQALAETIGHTLDIWAVCLSDHGAYGLSGAQDHGVVLWDVSTGTPVRRFELEEHWIQSVAFACEGKNALTTSTQPHGLERGCLTLWDLESGEILNQDTSSLGGGGHNNVKSLPGGKYALTSRDNELVVWDVIEWKEVRSWRASDSIKKICTSPDGRRALTCAYNGWMTVWDLESDASGARLEIPSKNLWDAAWSADGKRALALASDGSLVLWEPESGASQFLITGSGKEIDSFHGAMSQDGRWGITVRDNGFVTLWNLDRRETVARVSIPGAYVVAIAKGNVMFGGAGGTVHFAVLGAPKGRS